MNQKKFKNMVHSSRNSLAKDVFKRFMNNKAAVVGAVVLAIVLFGLIFADIIVPYEKVTAYDTSARLSPPTFKHIFGTDNLGRDLFARILHGSRISVGIGVGATMVSLCIAAAIASVCAMSKKADFVIMRIIDVVSCVPSILLALMFLAIMGGSVLNMMITLNGTGAFIWNQLQDDTDEAAIVKAMMAEYDVDEARAAQAVATFVQNLRNHGFLAE